MKQEVIAMTTAIKSSIPALTHLATHQEQSALKGVGDSDGAPGDLKLNTSSTGRIGRE